MLKKTVQFKDYDNEDCVEELYFNLTKTEMMDMLDLQPRLEAWSASVPSNPTDLDIPQIKELLEIIKLLIAKSYGKRSEDGKRFHKDPGQFLEFQESAAYDAFLYDLFGNPELALEFMQGILPGDIAQQAFKQSTETQSITTLPEPAGELNATDKEVPAYIREDREPTSVELANMTPTELQAAFRRKTAAQQA